MSQTKKSSHTPGPWKLKFWSENVGVGSDRPKPRDCESIALVPIGLETGVDSRIRETSIANARLIVAAPDLLAACESALGHLTVALRQEDVPAVARLRAAIAKARGE